ncbi:MULTISPECIES: RidA family protein [unclassified Sphingopyxis]|jgi:enamine deaminase RidA (YjgF/YER057c/UK114 family)|uniref:RidA family protein n=1 Tax=unclassified Sphingopyxis TaxID=2614943 RepID=UPI0025D50467|nr:MULTISPECIES: RidA family protein [unclassified Sphingopyxis]
MRINQTAGVITILAAALLPATATARDPANVLMPENPEARAFQEAVGYATAVIAGDTIYLSGVVAGPAKGESDLAPGYERAFAHIAATLARAGASWDDVVDITTFHTDLAAHIDGFAAVKNRHVKAPFPAWTAIGVSRLYEPTAVVEIKVVARVVKE